jgi:hypothetical protein
MPADGWADAAAAQVLLIAYSDPNARTQIANVLQYVFLEGRSEALRECHTIFAPITAGRKA